MSEPQATLPPQNREAEEAVLGSMLIDPEAIYDVVDFLQAEHFYTVANGWIYAAMLALHRRNEPIDTLTLISELNRRGQLNEIGAEPYIIGLTGHIPTSENAVYYAKMVSEAAKRRLMIQAGQRIAQLGYDESEDLAQSLQTAQIEAAAALDDDSQVKNKQRAGDVVANVVKAAEAARMGRFAETLSMPWTALHGVRGVRGAMIALGARPMMGKTSYLLQWMRHVAGQGQFCMFFSLEMTAEECMARIIMQATGIDEKRVLGMSGFEPLADAELQEVYRQQALIQELPLIIDDTGSMHVDTLQSRCRAESLRRGGEPIAVFVDYLQYLTGGRRGANNYESASDVSRKLKSTAKEVGWVVAAVQLSRNLESRMDKRPMQSDARDSGQIEQDANLFLALYRDEIYNPDTTEEPNIAEVLVLKNRAGRTGTFKLFWQGDAVSFRNLARETVYL